MHKLKAYCELVRLPNLFTAAADILAGYFLVVQEVHVSASLLFLLAASCCLYAAGMVINDLCDIEVDRQERPNRPLPSGRVAVPTARSMVVVLCAGGVIFATLGGSPMEPLKALTGGNRTTFAAIALLAAILLYDLVLKGTLAGPATMGLCRSLNFALPLTLARFDDPSTFNHVVALTTAFGFYVASFTYFGRDEAGESGRRRLVVGYVGVIAALLTLGVLTASAGDPTGPGVILWVALLVHLTRVGYRTIRRPLPEMVRYAMRTFIFGIVVWDAVVASLGADLFACAVVLCMMAPAMVLGRWVYST